MSFGGVALPTPSSTGAGDDRPPSSNAPSTPVPPAPPHFSSNFTFQGSTAPHRPYPPTTFSFPGPQMPSSAPPSTLTSHPFPPSSANPPRLPFTTPGLFPYQSTASNPPPAASGGIPPYGAPGQTSAVHMRPHNQSPISTQAPLPGTGAGQAPPQPIAPVSMGQGHTATVSAPTGQQLRPLSVQPNAIQPVQAPAIAGSISAPAVVPPVVPQVQTSAGQMSTSVGAVSTRPGPLPTPQYRAPFVANPALSLSSGVLGSAPAGMAPRFPGGPGPFVPIVRQPAFPPRAPGPLIRAPLGPLMRPGALVRPLLLEKPQTLVYVGKIAPTVDDECLRSILELCGPIKSWKRAQEPTIGSFGFCEFESAEGVLRALRLLNGFSLDGRELKLTVTQAAREYLERYVQKKKEREQQLKQDGSNVAEETAPGVETSEPVKKSDAEALKEDQADEVQGLDEKSFGIINEEDKEADEVAQKKLAILSEERAKQMPVPPVSSDADGKPASMPDTSSKLHGDSNADDGKTDGSNEEEMSEIKGVEKPEISSSDRGKKFDSHEDREKERSRERESKGRDRERERKREKDWEVDQLERERERSRSRRERDREMRLRDAERMYEDAEKAWEEREKEKERIRNVDKEKEREREKQRWRLIKEQEEESDDEGWKKSRRRDVYGERKRMQREREDDEKDRHKEEEEIVEAKRRKLKEDYEEQVKRRLAEMAQIEAADAAAKATDIAVEGLTAEPKTEVGTESITSESKEESHVTNAVGGVKAAAVGQEVGTLSTGMDVDEKRNVAPAPKKLGFGLVGTGKRAALPSVFSQEDEEDVPKDRVLRPLVPIEYTAEEMLAVSSLKSSSSVSLTPNLAAAAEFAKSLSNLRTSSSKDLDLDHDRERKQNEKSKEKNHDRKKDNVKIDTKQLIDTIPKMKDELFAYEIDWETYDQHALHERMRPWIEKKIEEFLGEEEQTLVEFIVSHTRKHSSAESMLELLTQILDDEAEMFVIKLWRMLIFEIKKVESGSMKS